MKVAVRNVYSGFVSVTEAENRRELDIFMSETGRDYDDYEIFTEDECDFADIVSQGSRG